MHSAQVIRGQRPRLSLERRHVTLVRTHTHAVFMDARSREPRSVDGLSRHARVFRWSRQFSTPARRLESSQTRPADRDSPSVPLRSAKVPALKISRRASEAESGPEGDILQCRQVRTNPRIILVFHELDRCQVGRGSHLGGLPAMTPWTRELHNVIRPWRALLSALPRRYMYVPWGSASDFL